MKHCNIAIFVPQAGCPHQCSYCDQRTITEQTHLPTGGEVRCTCEEAFREIGDLSNTEIAFFGGSFTSIPHSYMRELLEAAAPYAAKCRGIRISTRPDAIDKDILHMLHTYGVTAIELGAQSLDDTVLEMNGRGHTAADVRRAVSLIREKGFELGLQIMPGLYGSTIESDRRTAEAVCDIKPDTVRIYPVVILEGTKLAELFQSGVYKPIPFVKMIGEVADMMERFREEDIRVIKVGLHAGDLVEQKAVGGFYHPAFRELCESRIYRNLITRALVEKDGTKWGDLYKVAVHPACISRAIGHKQENLLFFYEHYGTRVYIVPDMDVAKFQCRLIEEQRDAAPVQ